MKKIYLLALTVFVTTLASAQAPTLTRLNNEPIIGDSFDEKSIDTTNTLPMNISGTNVTWNVNGISEGSVFTNTYSSPSADPNSSNYPGTTIILSGGNTTNYYKSVTTGSVQTFELLGLDAGFVVLNFNTNSAIVAKYPISMGYLNNDIASGAATVQTLTGTFSSTIQTAGDGTGTLNLNGATVLNNCLRLKTSQTIKINLLFGAITATITQSAYTYYHSSSKWPVFTVNYSLINSNQPQFNNQRQDQVSALANLAVGIKENNLNEIIFKAYPNPTTNDVNIHFVLTESETYNITILNTLGQIVKTVNKPNIAPGVYNETISTSDLSKGIYTIKVNGNKAQGSEKLIIN